MQNSRRVVTPGPGRQDGEVEAVGWLPEAGLCRYRTVLTRIARLPQRGTRGQAHGGNKVAGQAQRGRGGGGVPF